MGAETDLTSLMLIRDNGPITVYTISKRFIFLSEVLLFLGSMRVFMRRLNLPPLIG